MVQSSSIKAKSANGQSPGRLLWMDGMRGLIMVVMAIDHASFFVAKVHRGEFWGQPLAGYESAAEFLTRFITHFCAPGFFFLMGVGMMLFANGRYQIGWSNGKIARHFALRGAILMLFQLILEDPAWLIADMLNPVDLPPPPGGGDNLWIHLGVLFSLGAAMLIWGLLLRANLIATLIISFAAILLPQFLIPSLTDVNTLYSPLLRVLAIPGQTNIMQVYYPILPWLGLAGIGVAFGKLLLQDERRAFRAALIAGSLSLLLFVPLRAAGGFGNFHPPADSSWIAFLNLTKYPPSLSFMLVTMGGVLLLAVLFHRLEDGLRHWWGKPLLVFGRVPLFFYVVHLYLYALLGLAFPTGTSLGMMYLVWAIGLIILYPLCKWYSRFKSQSAPDSLWRLF
jgi:uncharacterized membrane protein